jgi:hypothetical protein
MLYFTPHEVSGGIERRTPQSLKLRVVFLKQLESSRDYDCGTNTYGHFPFIIGLSVIFYYARYSASL